MKTWRVIPICLALALTTVTSAAAQDSRGTEPHGRHGDEHGPAELFEELRQWGYSEDEVAAIQVMVEAVGQSIEEIMGSHGHGVPAEDTEEVRWAAESALMRFHDAYESVVLEIDDAIPDSPEDPLRALEREEIWERVEAGMASLSAMQKACFRLIDLEGMTRSEVSEALGVAEGTVRVHLHRVRRSLRRFLEPVRDGRLIE